MRPTLIYLGGNGPCAARLGPGRQSLLQVVDADLAFGCSQGRFKGFAGQPVHTPGRRGGRPPRLPQIRICAT